jgi:hypothetical protein
MCTGTLKFGLKVKVETYKALEDDQLLTFKKFTDIGTNGKEKAFVIGLGITFHNIVYILWLRLFYLGNLT